MAFQPNSTNTILYDLLINPETKAIFDRHSRDFTKKLPPLVFSTTLPSFATIVTPRYIATWAGVSEATLAELDRSLARVPVTTKVAAARCARYDEVPPGLPETLKAPAMLVFTKISGFRHESADGAAPAALKAMAERRGWTLFFTDNGAVFNPDALKRFQAVIWNNVSGDALTLTQQRAFRAYMESGGGFAAFHGSGGDPLYPWDWYADVLIGARFMGHPDKQQTAKVVVEDAKDAIVRDLNGGWSMMEEWYSFKTNPRSKGAHILATLDESTYDPKSGETDLRTGDHPIAWKQCVRDGRSFYTAIGHRPESYTEENSVKLLERGIAWAAGLGETQCDAGREGNR